MSCKHEEDIGIKNITGCGNLEFDHGICREDCEHYDQGENTPLTEAEKEQIRKHATKIHGKGLPKCSNCGHEITAPAGVCAPCESCGSSFGCGGV